MRAFQERSRPQLPRCFPPWWSPVIGETTFYQRTQPLACPNLIARSILWPATVLAPHSISAMHTCVRSLRKRSKWTLSQVAIIVCCFAVSVGQQKPPTSSPGALREFPLVLQQSIESGKAMIGTKVQAKLAVATMFEGTVIPRNAVFSGVVIESNAKSAKEPAKLAIRMETAEWKHGSSSMMAYLLPLYYPTTTQNFGDASQASGPTASDGGQGSSSESPMSHQSFPSNESQAAIPEISTTSNRPVQIKNVTVALADEGGAALVSEHSNIKLFKLTTYVFAAREPKAK